MLAAHKGVLLVRMDSAPRLPKKGPPWDIEGEPGGLNIFELKWPFEAKNKSNIAGHTGHYKSEPCCTKITSAPQISIYYAPWACTFHCDAALKLPDTFVLRPIERAHGGGEEGGNAATSTNMSHPHHMRDTHDSTPRTPATPQAAHFK